MGGGREHGAAWGPYTAEEDFTGAQLILPDLGATHLPGARREGLGLHRVRILATPTRGSF